MVVQYSDGARAAIDATLKNYESYSRAIGSLCIEFAELDRTIDRLFPLLLGCSEVQTACIVTDNIGAKCDSLARLVRVEAFESGWTEWLCDLLKRAGEELAQRRNRIVHDSWKFRPDGGIRVMRRAKTAIAGAGQAKTVEYNTEHRVTIDEIERLQGRVTTVILALEAAVRILDAWRTEGLHPSVPAQWIPACKAHHRCDNPQILTGPDPDLSQLHFVLDRD